MVDQGGESSFFPDIHESIDIRIDISISVRLMTTKCGKQVHLQDLNQMKLITPCQISTNRQKNLPQANFPSPLPLNAIWETLDKGPSLLKFAYSKLNSTFLLKIFFSVQYHDIKNALIYKVNCNLKLPQNYMKLTWFMLS